MNTQSNHKSKYHSSMPEVDEGWWNAVLAEEEQYNASNKPANSPKEKEKIVRPEKPPAEEARPLVPVNWEVVKKLYNDDCVIEMDVSGHNRGGLLVEKDGLAGFVPYSHLVELAGREHEIDRDIYLNAYTGKSLKVKVIECVPQDGRVVFSERAALTAPGKRTELFHALHAGSEVLGQVTNVTDFGVFVDLGGVEGLIHLSELSWGRVAHPQAIVSVGDEIKVQVLDLSVERNRVALSLKRLISNPWLRAHSEFPVGTVLTVEITSVLSYGAFARIPAGVEGLIHASEMPLAENQTPRAILTDGQTVQARVLHVDPAHQRLGLSMKIDHP
jgi:small subunit ribosomal protein S1